MKSQVLCIALIFVIGRATGKDWIKPACEDKDYGGMFSDAKGNGCWYYNDNQEMCGQFDGNGFIANKVCCACGGGKKSTKVDCGDHGAPNCAACTGVGLGTSWCKDECASRCKDDCRWHQRTSTCKPADFCSSGDWSKIIDCCSPESPCDEGHGDCDSDLDCKEGLNCGEQNCDQSKFNGSNADCCTSDVCIDITTFTKAYGEEISWTFGNCSSSTGFHSWEDEWGFLDRCCQPEGTYQLVCKDSYGDGWHGGYVVIGGTKYCQDFTKGKEKQLNVAMPDTCKRHSDCPSAKPSCYRGLCFTCTVDGAQGTGAKRGDHCGKNEVCHADGSCKVKA